VRVGGAERAGANKDLGNMHYVFGFLKADDKSQIVVT
jgi:hypothetical protein